MIHLLIPQVAVAGPACGAAGGELANPSTVNRDEVDCAKCRELAGWPEVEDSTDPIPPPSSPPRRKARRADR
jgi:hypothetical protein